LRVDFLKKYLLVIMW